MKNLIFISAFTFLFNWTATAAGHISRDSSWTYGGNGGLNLSQVSLSNWASGGENAVGFDVLLNYSADYKKNKHLWQNRIKRKQAERKKRMTNFIFRRPMATE